MTFHTRTFHISTNGSVASVCPVSRSQTPPGMPGIRVPAVPKVMDLPSAIAAVNAIADVLRQLIAYLRPGVNNVFPQNMPSGPSGQPFDGPTAGGGLIGQRWVEKDRVLMKLKYTSPQDDNVFITVQRIVSITWRDTVYNTNLTFTWPPEPGAEIVE